MMPERVFRDAKGYQSYEENYVETCLDEMFIMWTGKIDSRFKDDYFLGQRRLRKERDWFSVVASTNDEFPVLSFPK